MSEAAFPVTLTTEVIARIKAMIQKNGGENTVLRVGVKGGGCSGLEYMTRFEATPRPTDLVTVVDGITVVCDPKSAEFLNGSELTVSKNLIGGTFEFVNPNAARSCGCGTSFMPKTASE